MRAQASTGRGPRLTDVHKNALRIVAMMHEEDKPTLMPSSLANALERKGLVQILIDKWSAESLGLEHKVRFTEHGLTVWNALSRRDH